MRLIYSHYSRHRSQGAFDGGKRGNNSGEDEKLIVDVLTDEAVVEKRPKPALLFEDRMDLARTMEYVDVIVAHERS